MSGLPLRTNTFENVKSASKNVSNLSGHTSKAANSIASLWPIQTSRVQLATPLIRYQKPFRSVTLAELQPLGNESHPKGYRQVYDGLSELLKNLN